MASGIIKYWNGRSGWITPSGVANLPTAYATDILIRSTEILVGSGGTLANINLAGSSASLLGLNTTLYGGTASYTTASDQQIIAQAIVITLT